MADEKTLRNIITNEVLDKRSKIGQAIRKHMAKEIFDELDAIIEKGEKSGEPLDYISKEELEAIKKKYLE